MNDNEIKRPITKVEGGGPHYYWGLRQGLTVNINRDIAFPPVEK